MNHTLEAKYVLLIECEDGAQHEISVWGTDGEVAITTLKTIIMSTGGDVSKLRISVIDEDY